MSTFMSGTAAPSPAVTALPPGFIPSTPHFINPPIAPSALRLDRLNTPRMGRLAPAPEMREPEGLPSVVEGLPLAKREALRRYGPNVLPLFYTARRSAPDQLSWEALTPHLSSRLIFGLADQNQEIEPILDTCIAPGLSTYALTEFELQPGVVYAWRVEPLDAPETAPPQEGRFWVLSEDEKARCLQGCRALAEGGDKDFVALGMALFLTELELYQDALDLIKRGPARAEREARVLLAHTAQALVYRQMGKNLTESKPRRGEAEAPPADFLTWAANRERYHSDRASAQMDAAQATEGAPMRARSERRPSSRVKIAA